MWTVARRFFWGEGWKDIVAGHGCIETLAGALAGTAQSVDLWAHRRGAGGRRQHVLAAPTWRQCHALGGAGDLHHGRGDRRARRLSGARLGPAIELRAH